uniref:Secreted protein n=1 Tax=Globodera pallida TaxID=36090 RepID=A0A183CFX3_GLOPA
MEGTAATLLILVAVMFVNLLDNCAEGLQCRKGDATNNLNKSTDTSTFGACADPDSKFCFAAICKFTDSYAIIGWNCSLVAGEEECAADAKNMAENCYNKKIVSCECHFGKKGKDWSNALFDVPPSIQSPNMTHFFS